MTHPLESLIDQIVAEAMAKGELDDLPGAGKPLPPERDPQNALMNRMVKEAGGVPPAVSLKQQVTEATARLRRISDPTERKAAMKDLADLQLKLTLALETHRRYG